MFNVRVKHFHKSSQVQIFKQPIRENFDDRKFDHVTGEILGRGELIHNPFTDEMCVSQNMGDSHENLLRSVRRTKSKIYDIARSNDWEWFFTLTFNPDMVDSFDYDLCTQKLSKWLNNIRRKCPDMVYLVVPEQHESTRWHFHGLFAHVDNLDFIDSGIRDCKGRTIYNVHSYKLGFSQATKIGSLERACSYISKYITEDLCNITSGKKRYWASRNVKVPEIENYYVGMSELEIIDSLKNVSSVKTVSGFYTDVVYIETTRDSVDSNLFRIKSLNDKEVIE